MKRSQSRFPRVLESAVRPRNRTYAALIVRGRQAPSYAEIVHPAGICRSEARQVSGPPAEKTCRQSYSIHHLFQQRLEKGVILRGPDPRGTGGADSTMKRPALTPTNISPPRSRR